MTDDARSLLRAARSARKITHPHASYTSDNKLLCNLCETTVKSDAHWQGHLHSTQHNLRLQRQKDVAATRGAGDGGKKRKADTLDSPKQERKKVKGEATPATAADENAEDETEAGPTIDGEGAGEAASLPSRTNNASLQPSKPEQPSTADPDESDILAFERSLETLEAEAAAQDLQAQQAAATISAAPMTAEEVAAQAREEQSKQRGKRELELEDEREDAARVVEEEMEEMEGLEERVRKLRERRERLRGGSASPGEGGAKGEKPNAVDGAETETHIDGETNQEDESSDDDEDFDEWKFGGS